ncbi:MAG: Tat pathway signal protein [Clostridia bacterium]|nr:Tat pathway signal protein [Clostridia bacterium]
MKDLIWGYMLYLGDHMWADETSSAGLYLPKPYCEEMRTEVETWDAVVKFLAERKYNLVLIDVADGMKFDRHPEVSAPNAWEKDFLKKKLAEMRALGLEPIPKLNFSTGHDTWMKHFRRKVSTPEYYQFCADAIHEVCEVFGNPRFFHLGCDEEMPCPQDVEMVIARNETLWWHDLYFLFGECEKHGVRPWVWSDYIWKHEESFLKHMPKSVLQSNWYYYRFCQWGEKHAHRNTEWGAYELLDRHGYDQILTGSTWDNVDNLHQTVGHGKEKISPEHLVGFMTAPWLYTDAENLYAHYNDAHRFYLARKKFYPETL